MEKSQARIAPATEADLQAAGALMESVWRLHGQSADLVDEAKILNASGTDYVMRMQTASSAVFVAKIDDEVVGVASCIIRPLPAYYAQKQEAYIDDLSVSPRFQRRGVATQLVQECEKYAKSKGVTVLSAKVWAFNQPSAALMIRSGFSNDYSMYHKIIH